MLVVNVSCIDCLVLRLDRVKCVTLRHVMSQHDTWHVPDVILSKCSNDATAHISQYITDNTTIPIFTKHEKKTRNEIHTWSRHLSRVRIGGNNHREMWSLTLSIALFQSSINLNDRNIYKMVGIYDWFVQLTGAVKFIKITSSCPQPVSGESGMSGQKTV